MSKYIFGIHDPGGEALMADAPGTVVYTVNVAEDTPIDFSALAGRGYRALVRLNHSHHGQGTIPPNAADWPTFAETCALFVAGCRGVRDFTLGNEPNLAVEWGRPEPVLPEQYAHCYNLVHAAVKARKPSAQLSPAAIGPWNVESGVEWVVYFRRMLDAIPHSRIDFLTLNIYSRGYAPTSVTDNAWMDAPHHNRHNGFRAYKDFLDMVPVGLRDRPVDIKETNGNEPWPDQNTGWVQAAYAEIHRHNTIVGTQKIRTLCLFRWAHFDTRWDWSNKPGVHADFRAAVAHKYAAPAPPTLIIASQPETPTIKLPTVSAGTAALPARDIDERLRQRGMGIKGAEVQPGQPYWRLVRAVWMDEREAGGRHHIFVDALDEQGQRVPGVQFGVTWPSGAAMITTEAKPGEPWAGNFPMSPSRNEFSIRPMETGDAVNGIGMGADMGDGFNSNFHTSTGLVFQRSRAQDAQPQPAIPVQTMYVNSPDGLQVRAHPRVDSQKIIGLPHGEKVTVYETHADTAGHDRLWARVNGGWVAHWLLSETPPAPVPEPEPVPPRAIGPLVHPVVNPAHRRVSQVFGVNRARYETWGLDGHNGVDYATPEGARIRAVDSGRVAEVNDSPGGYGKYIRLEHSWGHSLYAHLSVFLVVVGMTVDAGQVIAQSGNTGNSTGPHLHFGIRINPFVRGRPYDGYVDPLPYLSNAADGESPVDPAPPANIVATVREAAREFSVDENLLLSLIWKESSYNPLAVNQSSGAKGLGQVMPLTWQEWAPKVGATNIFDARDNARVSAAYLNWCIRTAESERRGLWAYVWGPGRVLDLAKPGKPTQPPPEVIEYANTILHGRDLLDAVLP